VALSKLLINLSGCFKSKRMPLIWRLPGVEELATIERVLAKLEELALAIEFELHLKQADVRTQTASALEPKSKSLLKSP
jgi:hypothetical protein